jgi:hypothetical protein
VRGLCPPIYYCDSFAGPVRYSLSLPCFCFSPTTPGTPFGRAASTLAFYNGHRCMRQSSSASIDLQSAEALWLPSKSDQRSTSLGMQWKKDRQIAATVPHCQCVRRPAPLGHSYGHVSSHLADTRVIGYCVTLCEQTVDISDRHIERNAIHQLRASTF